MIPASYLFKTLYQDRFERERAPAETRNAETPPQDGLSGAHHPTVPYLALLGLFGLAR
ncbi:hypothetical protein [Kaistia sp. UC242_56]|uniref:hypothetical protein n=1 Tax=Kaistia sp. UC242_56 TaxID=3374625 RepID=UPI00378E78A7